MLGLAENEWLGMLSFRVNISQAHVHFGITGECLGWRETKFPRDLQSFEYLPPFFIALGNYCFSAGLLNVYFQPTKACS
jgi:hypothetical protein